MGLKNNNFWVKWDVDNPNNPSVPPETKFNMFGYAQINFHSYFKSSAIWAQCVLYSQVLMTCWLPKLISVADPDPG